MIKQDVVRASQHYKVVDTRNGDVSFYVLSRVGTGLMALVGIFSGNIWRAPAIVKSMSKLTLEEIDAVFGTHKYVHFELVGDYY